MPRRRGFLRLLLDACEQGVVLVDIGARDGLQRRWRELAPVLDVIAFEPEPDEAARLRASYAGDVRKVTVVGAAVWDGPGTRTLHVTRTPGCSSLFEPNVDFLREFPDVRRFDIVDRVQIDTTSLDAAMESAGARADFVKVDVQGGALAVLEGGEATMAGAAGAELEIELASMYEGEPLFGEVDAQMRSAGFELVDLRPTYWRRQQVREVAGTKGQLVFVDALYMARPEALAGRSVVGAVASAATYGLYDRVALYAEASGDPRLAPVAKAARQGTGAARVPEFRYRLLLGHALKDAGDALIGGQRTWARAEQSLGDRPRHPRLPWLH